VRRVWLRRCWVGSRLRREGEEQSEYTHKPPQAQRMKISRTPQRHMHPFVSHIVCVVPLSRQHRTSKAMTMPLARQMFAALQCESHTTRLSHVDTITQYELLNIPIYRVIICHVVLFTHYISKSSTLIVQPATIGHTHERIFHLNPNR
jgi:hypothetical protein